MYTMQRSLIVALARRALLLGVTITLVLLAPAVAAQVINSTPENPVAANATPGVTSSSVPNASPPEREAAATPNPPQPAPGEQLPPAELRVHHVPLMSVPANEDLMVKARVDASHLAETIVLCIRPAGVVEYERLRFRRLSTDAVNFGVLLPAARMTPGVFEYYIASQGIGQRQGSPEKLHFASPDNPHPVLVIGDGDGRWRRDLLAQHLGNRSRVNAQVEFVNFGSRQAAYGQVSDSYWRAELDYTYRFLGWLYHIRLGGGLLVGQTYVGSGPSLLQIPDGARCALPNHTDTDCRVGAYYGFAELRFRVGRVVLIDVRPILGVGPQSFDGGARGQIVIGHDPGTHVAVGVEGISHVGARGWLRLAWDTVPYVPMAFTIDLENFPVNDALAIRLMMNFGFRIGRHIGVDLLAGYATRGWQIGGPTLGGGIAAEF